MTPVSGQDGPDLGGPIVRQKLSDQVFERLWRMIVSGELAPGDPIPSERDLMTRFGVGRPAVREAMQALSQKGVIRIAQGERSRVNELNASIVVGQVDGIARLLLSTEPANLDYLKQLRKILETGCVRLAAEVCSAADAVRLRALIADQRAALDEPRAFVRADVAFHVAVAEIAGNPLVEVILQAMLTWLQDYYTPMLHWSGREGTTLAEHAQLVDCLEARDPDGAEAVMIAHLDRSAVLYAAQAG